MRKKFLSFFVFVLIALFTCSVDTAAQKVTRFGKEICRKYAELYYAGDWDALQEHIDENISGAGDDYDFPEEMLRVLRDGSDTLIAIDYEPHIYQLDSKIVYPKKDWTYCRFYFITGDGDEYTVLYVLRESGTFIRSLKSIVYYSGIEAPETIVYAGYNCLDNNLKVTDQRFYLCSAGWNDIEGKQVYLRKDGFTATQSMTIGGIRWKFGENGVCQGKYTGFTKSSKGRRYWKNGVLQKNRTVTLKNGTVYTADEKGYLTVVRAG